MILNTGILGKNIHLKFMSNLRILILGANGMLGKMVSLYFGSLKNYSLVFSSRSDSTFLNENFHDSIELYDVLNDNFYDLASKVKPDVIINCIGRIKPTIDEINGSTIRYHKQQIQYTIKWKFIRHYK